MFRMFAIVVNLATGQSQPFVDPQPYQSFEEGSAAMPAKYAAAKEVMTTQPRRSLIALGCASFEAVPDRGA